MNSFFKSKEEFVLEFTKRLKNKYLVTIKESSDRERYNVLSQMIMDYISDFWIKTNKKKDKDGVKEVYYFSMEFLLGRLTKSNIYSLGLMEVIEDSFKSMHIKLDDCLDMEKDPGLGNGGLGRLAACYFDSLASLKYPATGNTIRYRYGLFKQKIKNGYQEERPDNWLSDGFNYEIRKEEEAIEIPLYGYVNYENGKRVYHPSEYIKAVPYDVPIVGYQNETINTLRLWNAEPARKYPYNKSAFDYEMDLRNICGFLYPDDSSESGKRLRLVQQYFFSAAGLKSILNKEKKKYGNLYNLDKHVVIHLNDTHPTILIPELMRILLDEEDMSWDDAFRITCNSICYTNHSLLREVMESWNTNFVRNILPRIMEIIDEINRRFVEGLYNSGYKKEFVDEVAIIKNDTLYMANLCAHVSYKINGVAKLHTDLLKNVTLKEFNELYSYKFTNVTNGVTPRRWLFFSNPELTSLLTEYESGILKDLSKLENLNKYIDNPLFVQTFMRIKKQRKIILADYINEHNPNMYHKVDESFIFDVQVKRLHEYKRQLLNVLHIIYLYNRLKSDTEFKNNYEPHLFIFGAKAASGYHFAKKVIKLINSLAYKIDTDEEISKYLKIVFIENYGVTQSEIINPAIDVSEQISLASYEASGTGNMKAMMNGSITIGTLDGANVEIHDLVGDDNMAIFGYTKDEVLKNKKTYNPRPFYENNEYIKVAVDSLVNGFFDSVNCNEFKEIYDKLLFEDPYMVLGDFESYRLAQERINNLYKNKKAFAKICLYNTIKSYYFSSDRSIEDYAREIWHIEKL